jgi:hypothetical protein
MKRNKCLTCGKDAHDFGIEEALDCVPPRDIFKFGQYIINREYREDLYKVYPFYTTEEVVGSYLGHNTSFPSEREWLDQQDEDSENE